MGSIAYIVLVLLGKINHEDDLANICQLIAIDSIAFVLLLHWWSNRKGKRDGNAD